MTSEPFNACDEEIDLHVLNQDPPPSPFPNIACTTISDNISGLSIQQMFDCLESNVISPFHYKIEILTKYPNFSGPTTDTDLDNLFSQY